MLPKRNRLKGARVREVLKKGRVLQNNFFALRYAEGGRNENIGVGLVISNKVSKKATVRNKIKRAFMKAIGKLLPRVSKDKDMVFIAKGTLVGVSQDKIAKELEFLLKDLYVN